MLQAAELKPPVVADLPSFLADDARFAIAVAPLEDGFALDDPRIAVLTERQLFPERAGSTRRPRRAGREPEAIIRDLGELTEGAPIVHEDHGVGRYRGLIAMDVGGMPGEFLEIEYAKGDRLYVPVAQLHLISRYSGASAETAPLHSLGGEQWSKAKRKAAERCATSLPNCWRSRPVARRVPAWLCRWTVRCTSRSQPDSRSRKPPISWPPSTPPCATSPAASRWTV